MYIIEAIKKQSPKFERALDKVGSICPPRFTADILANCLQNDPAHGPGHVLGVVNNAIDYIDENPELVPYTREIIVAAFCHDCQSHVNRSKHELLGAEYTTRLIREYRSSPVGNLTGIDERLVYNAILRHRSSFKGKREHMVEDVVASADKGLPNIFDYIKSAMLYRLGPAMEELNGIDDATFDLCFTESVAHIREKFGPAGYAWVTLPSYYKNKYSKEILELKESITNETFIEELYEYTISVRTWLINQVERHSQQI